MSRRCAELLWGLATIGAIAITRLIPVESNELWRFITAFAFLYYGYLLGNTILPKIKSIKSIWLGLLLFVSLQSLVQTGLYYFGFRLGQDSDAISLISAIFLSGLLAFFFKPRISAKARPVAHNSRPQQTFFRVFRHKLFSTTLFLAAVLAFAFIIKNAAQASTLESIRTPWPLLPKATITAIAILWMTLLLSSLWARSAFLGAIHGFLATSATTFIAPLIYRLGFGFDGFLHIASEKILLGSGFLEPKPFYYIGEYVFTTWLARFADLPIAQIDRWLLPVAAAILPTLCLLTILKDKKAGLSILALLPLAAFVSTTPQGLAYILGLTALILCLGTAKANVHFVAPLIVSAWAIAVHPLAGIPLLFVVLATLSVIYLPKKTAIAVSAFSVITAGIAVPLLFYFLSLKSGTSIAWNFNQLFHAEPWLSRLLEFVPFIGNHFTVWPAWASLTNRLIPLILFFAALLAYKSSNDKKERGACLVFIFSALIFYIAAVALKATGDFTFLIDYERSNYGDRLNILALLCLVPPAGLGLNEFWKKARKVPLIIFIAAIAFYSFIAAAASYNALPRHDAIAVSRGWSTSRYDLEAVQLIDRDAGNRAYTVLANQSVSAAAVSLLGFKRYTALAVGETPVFFYPIPTGGVLYELYLQITYNEPSMDILKDAAELGRSDLVYVVLNDYWWRAQTVAEQIREIADQDWDISDGKVWVYKFDLRTDSNDAPAAAGL
ncbi:hypothetical protein KKF59_02675 [Patescibacteria group bacterium]|nr:hypothetical protein [Patescibacteria group bacterium]MBU1629456.1 hypothetical protein [Patescibacteria group bacterium]MBU1908012.1 hypothetical protein [Patescibacteria group bacterium]